METHSPVRVIQKDLSDIRKIVAKNMVKSQHYALDYSGTQRSPFRTRGLDFQEVRAYQPGDDVRQIDWRITAKYGRPFTKLYTEEKELPVSVLCDMRTAMKFASHGDFKSVVAAKTAFYLFWSAVKHKNRLMPVVLEADMVKTRSAGFHTNEMGTLISDFVSAGNPDDIIPDAVSLEQGLSVLEKNVKTGALVFVISDFHDWSDSVKHQLQNLGRRRTLHLIHIYDVLETEMPVGIFDVSDGQNISRIDMQSGQSRKQYKQIFQDRCLAIRNAVRENGWGYLSVLTTDDYLSKLDIYCRGGV